MTSLSDFDLDLIQAISAYILKDKYNFIFPLNLYNDQKQIRITTYFLLKVVICL